MPYPSDRNYISFLRQLVDKFESSRCRVGIKIKTGSESTSDEAR